MVLIPKARRGLLGTAKDFRLISLTSFILKLMERLVDRYIRKVPLVENTLRREKHAYQEGKSAETALAEAFMEIEKGIKSGFALTVLLDIEGAFNRTSVESICQGASEHDVSGTVKRCMWRFLNSRRVVAEWKGYRRQVWVGKVCPQSGVLSATMLDRKIKASKYLGVVLDQTQLEQSPRVRMWGGHLKAYWVCRRAFGTT